MGRSFNRTPGILRDLLEKNEMKSEMFAEYFWTINQDTKEEKMETRLEKYQRQKRKVS